MGLTGYSAEFVSPISPAKMFKATVLDMHNLLPKVMPQLVKSAALVQGDGGVETVKEYHFSDGLIPKTLISFPYKYVKEHIDLVDKDNFACKYSLVEGGFLGSKIKSAKYEIKFDPSGNGGSVCKFGIAMDTLDGVEYTPEQLNKEKEGMVGTYKAIEAYLLANPDA